eukprot:273025-Prorocentrum_minimum.AAC.3
MVISSPSAMGRTASSTASPFTSASRFMARALGRQEWLQQLCSEKNACRGEETPSLDLPQRESR